MKTLFILLVIISSSSFGQVSYQTSGTTEDLNFIEIINDQLVYVSGENGVLIKTTNGGNQWNALNNFTSNSIYSMSFISADTGYVITWDPTQTGAFESQLWKTVDGGNSFLELTTPQEPLSVNFISNSIGFYTASDGLYKTIDGGLSWYQVHQEIGLIKFATEFVGYGVNNDRQLLKSVDAGETWAILFDMPNGEFYVDITCPSADVAFTTSYYYGSYSGTVDGGQTAVGGLLTAKSMDFPSNTIGYHLSYHGLTDSTLIGYTFDQGMNWDELHIEKGELNLIRFFDNTTGWAIGNNGKIIKFYHALASTLNVENLEQVHVFPNPTSSFIQINTHKEENVEKIRLFNLKGTLLLETEEKTMNLEHVSNGLYMLEVVTSTGVYRSEVLKK